MGVVVVSCGVGVVNIMAVDVEGVEYDQTFIDEK
jgi:hypothetical protein